MQRKNHLSMREMRLNFSFRHLLHARDHLKFLLKDCLVVTTSFVAVIHPVVAIARVVIHGIVIILVNLLLLFLLDQTLLLLLLIFFVFVPFLAPQIVARDRVLFTELILSELSLPFLRTTYFFFLLSFPYCFFFLVLQYHPAPRLLWIMADR